MAEALEEPAVSTVDSRKTSYYDDTGHVQLPELIHFRDPHGFVQKLAVAGFEAYLDYTNERGYPLNPPVWKTRCVECQVILYGWTEDDMPIDEHCRAIDRFCGFVTRNFAYLNSDLQTQISDNTETESAGQGEFMDVVPPDDGDACSECRSKAKVKYTICGHLWCMRCVNKDEDLHDRCPVCLKENVQPKVYTSETIEIAAPPTLEQKRRSELARAFLNQRCDVCPETRDKIVLLSCEHIVCIHYEDETACPMCNQEVTGMRNAVISPALRY